MMADIYLDTCSSTSRVDASLPQCHSVAVPRGFVGRGCTRICPHTAPVSIRDAARSGSLGLKILKLLFTFLPRCMECRRGLTMRFLSVCPSVCLSVKRVHCDKTEEKSVQIFTPYERPFILVFREEEWLVGGRPLLPEILGQPARVGAKSPILNQ